jgi:hypothetical protein
MGNTIMVVVPTIMAVRAPITADPTDIGLSSN